MDLLYVLGTGSPWLNNELRFSLRSAQRHYPVDRVIIVGERPAWLTDVVHIPCDDPFDWKVSNVIHKIETAVKSGILGIKFTLMNDDHFFLRDHPEDLPVYVHGIIASLVVRMNEYRATALHTLNMLRATGVTEPLNYGVHFPMVLETDKVTAVLHHFGGSGTSYLFRSAYGNMHRLPAMQWDDVKQRGSMFKEPPPTSPFLSINDSIATDSRFQRWITKRFPEKSRWEN